MLANGGDPDQTPRLATSDLGLHYLPRSQKWDTRHDKRLKITCEPRHDTTNIISERQAKTQLSLRPVWSESLLSAWRKLESLATHWAHSECPSWSESSMGAHSFCWFCHVVAHVLLFPALKASRGEEITSDEETEESLFEQPSPGGTEESFLGEAQAGLDRMDQVQGFAGGAGGAGGAGDGGESHGGEDRGRDKNKSSKKNKKDKKDRSSSKSKKDGSKSKSKKDRSKSKSKKDRSKSKSKKESSKSPKKAKKGKEPKRPKSKSPKPGKTKKSPKSKRTGGGGRKFGKRR